MNSNSSIYGQWRPDKAFRWLLVVYLVYALPFLGGVHLFDWDEVNFAECAREMIITGDWRRVYISFLPFWEKPPFFIWEQALAMKLFGVNEYAARFPNAVCGLVTLIVLYIEGKRLKDGWLGFWFATSYLGMILPAFYFKSGIIDPVFNLFIFLGLVTLYRHREQTNQTDKPIKDYLWAGLWTGLAVLTKGPVALLITGLVGLVDLILRKGKLPLSWLGLGLYGLSVLAVPGLWFGIETVINGPWFLEQFVSYQIRLFATPDAGHGGFFGYHFVVLLIGCFPMSLVFLPAMAKWRKLLDGSPFYVRLMLILFWVVLILFSLVKSKIIHYSSMAYFPVAIIAGAWIYKSLQEGFSLPRWARVSLFVLGAILCLPPIVFPMLIAQKALIIPFIKDGFAQANLEADVRFVGIEWTIGFWFAGVLVWFCYHVRKSAPLSQVKAWLGLQFGTMVYIFLILVGFMGRVEMIVQNAAIEMLKSLADKDAYVVTVGHKSYAHLFYGALKPTHVPGPQDGPEWVQDFIRKPHEKDVYALTKVTKKANIESIPEFRKLAEKNGFALYLRKAGQ